jgi:peptide/nickel transport system permease protein
MLLAAGRILSLVVLAALGTVALMRFAPGYFTDPGELDAQHASVARVSLQQQQNDGSFAALTRSVATGWMHGNLGRSRQYDVPVSTLIGPRLRVSARLLFSGVLCGWIASFALALPLSSRRSRKGDLLVAAPSSLLLAVPIGAMAIGCMTADLGGPVLVLTLLIAARDFKFAYRLLRQAWTSPHLLYASAQGLPLRRILWKHLLPPLRSELLSLLMMSFVLALSALVPIEVIFDLPGLGQLAWSAAMNRDLPVLVAVTLIMAACVGAASLFAQPERRVEALQCA